MRTGIISDDKLRAMYAGGRGDATARRFSRLWASVFGLGLMPRRWVTLEVEGRRTGRTTRFPLGMADWNGRSYLVPMLGEDCSWVKNVRAAGGAAVLRRGRAVRCRLVEIPVPERAPILRRYLAQVPGARPHLPLDRNAPLADFAEIAPRYPVFRVDPDSLASGGNDRAGPRRGAAVLAYIALAYGLSWAWLLPMVASGATAEPGSGWPTHFPALVGPLVAAVVVATVTGRLRPLVAGVVRVRVGVRWWLMALSPLGIGAVAAAVGYLATGSLPAPAGLGVFAGISALAGPAGVAAVLVVVNGFGEETGWRGYLLPALQRRFRPLTAMLLLAPIWALWHAPMFAVVSTFRGFGAGTLVGWFLGLVCGSVVLGWLYNRTGSIAIVAVWHGLFNVVSGTAAAAGLIAAVSSTVVMVLAVGLIGAEVLATRRGRATVLGPPVGHTEQRRDRG